MMFVAFIAVCLSGTPVPECDKTSAVSWVAAPEKVTGISACMIHGMQYAAESRLVDEGSYAKVFCRVVA